MDRQVRDQKSFNLNDMWLAKDNRFLNPMSTYERNLMAPTCLIINIPKKRKGAQGLIVRPLSSS